MSVNIDLWLVILGDTMLEYYSFFSLFNYLLIYRVANGETLTV